MTDSKSMLNVDKNIDEVDLKILSELQKDGRLSLSELGRRVGLKHSSVRERLFKLLNKGMAKIQANINLKQLKVNVACLALEVANYDRVNKIIKVLESCPRTILVASTSGEYNVIALVLVEDMEALRIFIEKHIRPLSEVKKISISFGEVVYPEYFPLKPLIKFKEVNKSLCLSCNLFSR